jgi:ribosomal protein S30
MRRYQPLLNSGEFNNRAAPARILGVSRARVTQVLSRLEKAGALRPDTPKQQALAQPQPTRCVPPKRANQLAFGESIFSVSTQTLSLAIRPSIEFGCRSATMAIDRRLLAAMKP